METGASGYILMETEEGVSWDVTYNPDTADDIIIIDADTPIHLTKSDIQTMLEALL